MGLQGKITKQTKSCKNQELFTSLFTNDIFNIFMKKVHKTTFFIFFYLTVSYPGL
jgi:hypothetical protein